MGFFDWLTPAGDKVLVLEDAVWMTRDARRVGISAAVGRSLDEPDGPSAVLLVAHFPDRFRELEQLLADENFDNRRVAPALAGTLDPSMAASLAMDESRRIDMIIAERHPLLSHDERVVDFARSLPCRSRLAWHLSLDDGLMRVFAGERVEGILKRLGMSEDEAIQSRLITNRVKKAQQKIENQSIGNAPADSAETWLATNCPDSLE